MLKYTASRLLHMVPVLLAVSVVVFALLHLIPGDPIRAMASPLASQEDIANLRTRLGLDQPLPVQYWRWLSRALTGDLGRSVRTGVPVSALLLPRLVNTLRLTFVSMVIAVTLGLAAGVIASLRRNSPFDAITMVLAVGGFSIPPFWLGLMLILVFSVKLKVFPAGGGDSLAHIVLPAISLGIATTALIARMTRSSMLEVLSQDYIRTARSKGLAAVTVIGRHALRNAMLPVVTVIGLQFGVLMAGAVVTEVVFSWPGVGWLLVNSILNRDFPIVQASLLVTTALFILVNLVVDLAYAYFDPRIRY